MCLGVGEREAHWAERAAVSSSVCGAGPHDQLGEDSVSGFCSPPCPCRQGFPHKPSTQPTACSIPQTSAFLTLPRGGPLGINQSKPKVQKCRDDVSTTHSEDLPPALGSDVSGVPLQPFHKADHHGSSEVKGGEMQVSVWPFLLRNADQAGRASPPVLVSRL